MKNKFEALKAFIDWPADWQRLCLLVFAEGYNEPEAGQLTQAEPVRDCIDQGEMKLEPMPVRRAAAKRPVLHFMRYTRDELVEIDVYLCSGVRPLEVARRMDKKHPGQRTVEAWENEK